MTAAILTMSAREFERAALMRKIDERRLTQVKAAELLGLSADTSRYTELPERCDALLAELTGPAK